MPKFFGCKPAGPTRQAVEKFENEVMVRQDSQMLVGTVYLDMQEVHDRLPLRITSPVPRDFTATRTLLK